jgi:DNA-binding XRE family transcriptional regulator
MASKTIMRRSPLHTTRPYEVEAALKRLGANLRTASLRRNVTLVEAAERLGVSRQVIADAERGKPSTSVAVYAALLWSYGLIERLASLATVCRRGRSAPRQSERAPARPYPPGAGR